MGTVRRREPQRPRRRLSRHPWSWSASLSCRLASLSHAGPSRFNSRSFVTRYCRVGIQGEDMHKQELASAGSSGLGGRSQGGGRTAGSAGHSLRQRRGPELWGPGQLDSGSTPSTSSLSRFSPHLLKPGVLALELATPPPRGCHSALGLCLPRMWGPMRAEFEPSEERGQSLGDVWKPSGLPLVRVPGPLIEETPFLQAGASMCPAQAMSHPGGAQPRVSEVGCPLTL